MQTLRTATAVFTLSPTRNVGELQAKLAKCNGKYKPTKIKPQTLTYQAFTAGMSTARYVQLFVNANGNRTINAGFFAPLNTEPCTLYTGEDSFETVPECEVIDFPVQIDARELQGAELDAAYAEFAFAA